MTVNLDQHVRQLHRTDTAEQHAPTWRQPRIFHRGLRTRHGDAAIFDIQDTGSDGFVQSCQPSLQ